MIARKRIKKAFISRKIQETKACNKRPRYHSYWHKNIPTHLNLLKGETSESVHARLSPWGIAPRLLSVMTDIQIIPIIARHIFQ